MVKGKILLHKYHALGNDFLLCDSKTARFSKQVIGKLAQRWCDRHTGVGADGLLWLRPSRLQHAIVRMDIFNSDGTWAERSGNGQRIVGAYLRSIRKFRKQVLNVESSVGLARVAVQVDKGVVTSTAFLSPPDFQADSLPMRVAKKTLINADFSIAGEKLKVTCVSVGNPHVVVHVKNQLHNWRNIGRRIESDARFPKRTNVEFVRVRSRAVLDVFVWERGAGETGSSGTGAAASLAAMVTSGYSSRTVTINFPAGKMKASWPADDAEISTTAPVEYVGRIEVAR